ncbi:potassium voltage-gated channel subfamily KQT member 1-like isoform X3 [Hydractinia symbiolongicarpus]|uniref:potassium voltage-gated channel subfamily KQT member 1-like isoform X3 n=1 Tax=Hydractinia symbiolongicarpus TaxID=13093 RepID=UPI00254CD1AF|nr:potassium voltage-gated channel subfamily KQT member 1-like isoform X3 [Hydractinia symbiolongicarpus]
MYANRTGFNLGSHLTVNWMLKLDAVYFQQDVGYHVASRFHDEEEVGVDAMKHHLVQHFSEPSRLTLPGTHIPLHAQSGIELLTLEKMTGVAKAKKLQQTRKRYKEIQIKVFNLLERPRTWFGVLYHGVVFLLIMASLFLSVIITMKDFEEDLNILNAVYYLEISLVIVFSVEYILRMWSCSCHGNYKGFWGKMRFIKKPYMVIDIIVIVATTVVVATTTQSNKSNYFSVSVFRFLRFLQVLRILRLDRQRGAFKIVSHVVYEHRQELMTCWYMSFILLVACSFLVYLAEKSDEQPDTAQMKDLGEGMYFAIITLLTVGYGDISPQNWVAKILTCVFAFVGTAFFALPAGILGSGFAIQVAQNQKRKHFNRRRYPAALVIQYSWKWFVSNQRSDDFPATWIPHQVLAPLKEKKYSTYSRSPGASPTGGRRSMSYLRKKFHSTRNYTYAEGDGFNSRRSSIGATIPSALDLRDRCQSEGNLLLVGPRNFEDNQATIVSLPPEYRESVFDTRNAGLYNSTQDIHFKPLTEYEKNAIRFIRKIKFRVAIRKFREECRPYDVKDVIEQYTEGQMEMFGFIKKFQLRLESTLGIRESESIDPRRTLNARLGAVEHKVDNLDSKLDSIIELLTNKKKGRSHDGHHHHRHHHHDEHGHPNEHFNQSGDAGDSDVDLSHESIPIVHIQHSKPLASRDEYMSSPRDRKRGMTFHADEVSKRLEKLMYESTDSSIGGVESNLKVPADTPKRASSSRFIVTTTPDLLLQRTNAVDIRSGENSNRSSTSSLPILSENNVSSHCSSNSDEGAGLSSKCNGSVLKREHNSQSRRCKQCISKSLGSIPAAAFKVPLDEMTLNFSESVPQLPITPFNTVPSNSLLANLDEEEDDTTKISTKQTLPPNEHAAIKNTIESSELPKENSSRNNRMTKQSSINGHVATPRESPVQSVQNAAPVVAIVNPKQTDDETSSNAQTPENNLSLVY